MRASGKLGVRLALSLITSLSEAEAVRLEAGAPYDSVADARDRARPTRTNLRRLAQLGALDRFLVKGAGGRADLVHHLDAQREGDGFTLYTELSTEEVKGLSDAVNALSEPLASLTAAVV